MTGGAGPSELLLAVGARGVDDFGLKPLVAQPLLFLAIVIFVGVAAGDLRRKGVL